MDCLTRREFLRRLAALGMGTMVGTALSACGTPPEPTPTSVSLRPTATASAAAPPTLIATRTT
jgi:hypothetical protein